MFLTEANKINEHCEAQNEDNARKMLAILNDIIDGHLGWELDATNWDKQDVTVMWDRIMAAGTRDDVQEMTAILLEIMDGDLAWRLDAVCGDLTHVDAIYARIRSALAKGK